MTEKRERVPGGLRKNSAGQRDFHVERPITRPVGSYDACLIVQVEEGPNRTRRTAGATALQTYEPLTAIGRREGWPRDQSQLRLDAAVCVMPPDLEAEAELVLTAVLVRVVDTVYIVPLVKAIQEICTGAVYLRIRSVGSELLVVVVLL